MSSTQRHHVQWSHVELRGGDWVVLRGLEQEMLTELSGLREGSFRIEALYRAIFAWGGPGFGCKCGATKPDHRPGCAVAPVTIENIRALEPQIGASLFAELQALQSGN